MKKTFCVCVCVTGGDECEAGGVSEEGAAGERGLQGQDGQTRRAVQVRTPGGSSPSNRSATSWFPPSLSWFPPSPGFQINVKRPVAGTAGASRSRCVSCDDEGLSAAVL